MLNFEWHTEKAEKNTKKHDVTFEEASTAFSDPLSLTIELRKREVFMNQSNGNQEMLDEYDFSKGIRGKYAERYKKGTNVIVVDPDVAEYFSDSKTINDALRSIIPIIRQNVKKIAESGSQGF